MKKIIFLIFYCVFLNAYSPILKENDDYVVLKTPFLDAKDSVIEIFSYQCIFCYKHHKVQILEKIKEQIPNLKYYLIPASSMAKNGKEFNEIFLYAQYLDFNENIDSSNKFSNAKKIANLYFNSYFDKKEEFDYELGLGALNINKTQLNDFLKNKKDILFFKNYNIANEFVQNYGTPSYIVNGKYKINTKKLKNLNDLINIIKELKNYE